MRVSDTTKSWLSPGKCSLFLTQLYQTAPVMTLNGQVNSVSILEISHRTEKLVNRVDPRHVIYEDESADGSEDQWSYLLMDVPWEKF